MAIGVAKKLASPLFPDLDINKIGAMHFDWVERMGWHNKTVLEALALIASEIGEAADESFGPTDAFGEELADIILRSADLAHVHNIDLAAAISGATISWRTNSLTESFAEIMVDMAKWINTARPETLDDDFTSAMGIVIKRVLEMADWADVDLPSKISKKMEINEQRGTRGRRI